MRHGWILAALLSLAACGSADDDGGGFEQALADCGLVTEGVLPAFWAPSSSWASCVTNCLAAEAGCMQLENLICGLQTEPVLDQCWRGCVAAIGHTCADGELLSEPQICDGIESCSDGSDEQGCASFDCGDGNTVLEGQVCDTIAQCPNQSDEANCGSLYFSCDDMMMPAIFRCDGQSDCSDNSDELGCASFSCP